MADTKISSLPSGSAAQNTDLIPIARGGNNFAITVAAIAALTPQGPQGATGATGTRGSLWNVGAGAPGTISGQINGDLYLNISNGDVYALVTGTWTFQLALNRSVVAEVPSGTQDGTNTLFTLAHSPTKAAGYQNGYRLVAGVDYSISGTTVTYFTAPAIGDVIIWDYQY